MAGARLNQVIWGPPNLDHNGPPVPIWSPRPGKPITAILLEDAVHGCTTHFVNGRTTPCTGQLFGCEGCTLGRRTDWKGYIAGFDKVHGRIGIIEITLECYRTCPSLQADPLALRGGEITLTRQGTSAQARVRATFGPRQVLDGIPEAFNVKKALERIWFGNRLGTVVQPINDKEGAK